MSLGEFGDIQTFLTDRKSFFKDFPQMVTQQEILDAVGAMSIIELNDLVKAFEDKFGISIANLSMPSQTGSVTTPIVEEQTEFTVILNEIGANKVSVIKAVRELTSLGLKEAKDLVDSAPKPVKESVSRVTAEEIKKKLEDAGAKVQIK